MAEGPGAQVVDVIPSMRSGPVAGMSRNVTNEGVRPTSVRNAANEAAGTASVQNVNIDEQEALVDGDMEGEEDQILPGQGPLPFGPMAPFVFDNALWQQQQQWLWQQQQLYQMPLGLYPQQASRPVVAADSGNQEVPVVQ